MQELSVRDGCSKNVTVSTAQGDFDRRPVHCCCCDPLVPNRVIPYANTGRTAAGTAAAHVHSPLCTSFSPDCCWLSLRWHQIECVHSPHAGARPVCCSSAGRQGIQSGWTFISWGSHGHTLDIDGNGHYIPCTEPPQADAAALAHSPTSGSALWP